VIELEDGEYLCRYYLFGRLVKHNYPHARGFLTWMSKSYYIHRFLKSDQDRALHNHPWEFRSVVLCGAYREEYRTGTPGAYRVVSRVRRAGSVAKMGADHFHRVDLVTNDVWTLFITGKKIQTWGFWDRERGVFIPHHEYAPGSISE
jgi:hypothetical protein